VFIAAFGTYSTRSFKKNKNDDDDDDSYKGKRKPLSYTIQNYNENNDARTSCFVVFCFIFS